uniref:Uncharacterized protein n=1 Tax=Solanum tuberosum TaxID=4113 RepID=M1DHU8_SOLTU
MFDILKIRYRLHTKLKIQTSIYSCQKVCCEGQLGSVSWDHRSTRRSNLWSGSLHFCIAFSKFKFCNVWRWSTASRNHSVTRRLLLYLSDSIFSFRAWHTGTLGETKAIQPLA